MKRHVRTPDEIKALLTEQIGYLRTSARLYDEGDPTEAKRLATVIYTLMHDGRGKTKSLLGQARLMSQLSVPSTNMGLDHMTTVPLCVIHFTGGQGAEFAPRLGQMSGRQPAMMTTRKWWEEDIYRTDAGAPLSRKNLVHAMRSQDGGSHVDADLDGRYHWLMTRGDVRVSTTNGDMELWFNQNDPTGQPIKNGHLATMRQIAWEIDTALRHISF